MITDNNPWCIHYVFTDGRTGLTAKVATIKPPQRYKCNTKSVQIHKNKTLSKQNKNNMTGTKQYNRNIKALKSENRESI
jgi:hypothetical protein